jgi:hypothetical protein
MNFTLCSANTRSGVPCRFVARRATGLCINHDPSYKDTQRKNVERGVRRSRELRQAVPTRLANVDLADRASVQAAVELVFRLYLLNLLSEKRMRLLVRALGVASRNFEHHKGVADSYRRSLEYASARATLNRHFLALTEQSDAD